MEAIKCRLDTVGVHLGLVDRPGDAALLRVSFPRKRESSLCGIARLLDPRLRGDDMFKGCLGSSGFQSFHPGCASKFLIVSLGSYSGISLTP